MLYHGTTEQHLSSIIKRGIVPRALSQVSNWAHTVDSNSEAVYLSNAYPLYFAFASGHTSKSSDRFVVLEINDSMLVQDLLCSDEDALEQLRRGHDGDLSKLSITNRTEYYREMMHDYSSEISLNALGTCAYLDVIPVEYITRVALVDERTYTKLVMTGYDPQISIWNYKFIGENYRKSTTWLFDPDDVKQEHHDLGNGMMVPRLPILDSRSGIDVMSMADFIATTKS